MNGKSPAKASFRRLLNERLCDQAAGLAVLSISSAFGGFFIMRTGLEVHEGLLTMAGMMGLTTPGVVAWILHDPDAPAPAPRAPVGPGEIEQMSDAEFDRLLDEVERQAFMPFRPPSDVAVAGTTEDEAFAEIVRDALDELPELVQHELRSGNLAVTISDEGWRRNAYGLYHGGTVANGDYGHHITIYRDTLTESYGHDPDELRRQVAITVRHEVAHHFGADERHVRELGL